MKNGAVFIAGGTGVVGRRVIPALVSAGYRVLAAARSMAAADRLRTLGASPVLVDLFDASAVRRAAGKPDIVINLATHMPASSTRMLLPWAWRENDRLRRTGAANLAAASRTTGADCFIQESFAPIYSGAGDHWIDETWPVAPARYNRSTLDAERSANAFTREGGRGIVLRFASFYGPDAFTTREMIGMARKGMSPLPGSLDAFASWVSHDDAASAVAAAITAPSGTYNIVDDEPLTRGEWLDSLAAALAIERPRPMPRLFELLGGSTIALLSRSQRIANAKFRDVTGWRPATPSMRDAWADLVKDAADSEPGTRSHKEAGRRG
ncbi:MAG TPA: NAD(P)-dependent oxidoreductase [Gemmatimonadaceae bacterium]|jgi:nucleoside-diphosphate-sugar epimerase|nr:NAD(P)-dependent oxidoreductase [Gemmatimonadaceae bacterium]